MLNPTSSMLFKTQEKVNNKPFYLEFYSHSNITSTNEMCNHASDQMKNELDQLTKYV